MSVGPTIWMPIMPMSRGARARTISSLTIVCRMTSAPWPPYSLGHPRAR